MVGWRRTRRREVRRVRNRDEWMGVVVGVWRGRREKEGEGEDWECVVCRLRGSEVDVGVVPSDTHKKTIYQYVYIICMRI